MLSEYYEQIEAIGLNLALVILFIVMGFAVRDVLKKNNVPKMGQIAVYTVLFLGTVGFLAKGLIQLFFS